MMKMATIVLVTVIASSFVATVEAADKTRNLTDLRAAVLESEISMRIVGGERAENNAWPWQVVLYVKAGRGTFSMSCGGSLIHPRWVLTAAHCVDSLSPDDYAVVEGASRIDNPLKEKGSGRVAMVRKVLRHEAYNAQTKENDIALLELATPAKSKPVQLSLADSAALEAAGTLATVTGWGTLQAISQGRDVKTGEIVQPNDPRFFTNDLMQVELPVVSEDTCQSAYRNIKMDRRMLCAGLAEGGKDSCQGDSGGPLVAKAPDGNFRQIGVVSFGRQCAAKEAYGVYTRVSSFQDWVQDNAKIKLTQTAQPLPSVQAQEPVNPVTNPAGLAVSVVQGDTLAVGKNVQFRVTSAKSGFLVLIDITPDGKLTQIYPNKRSLSTPTGGAPRSNVIDAGRTLTIPDPKNPYEGFEYTADLPAGEGLVVAILSAEPLKSVALPTAPTTMSATEALEFLTKVTDELGRSIEIVPIGKPATATSVGKLRDWSFATRTYRIVP